MLTKLFRYLQEEGLQETLRRAIATPINFIFSQHSVRVYSRPCEESAAYPAAIAAVVEELASGHFAEIDALAYHSTKDIRHRMKNGERCFAAKVNGVISCSAWVVTSHSQSNLSQNYPSLKRGQLYIYNVRTARTMRGKGLYPFLLTAICSRLAKEGFHEALIAADTKNIPSIRGIEKAGFKPTATIHRTRLLGTIKSERIPIEASK